jgi:TetR/AcrR family transcriptional repressor of mexCD-oprJ operon
MRELFERGAAECSFRTDLPAATIIEIYVALLEGAASRVSRGRMVVEDATTAVTTIFLTGVLAAPSGR